MIEKGCSCSQDYSIVIREYSTASKAKEFNTTQLQQQQRQVWICCPCLNGYNISFIRSNPFQRQILLSSFHLNDLHPHRLSQTLEQPFIILQHSKHLQKKVLKKIAFIWKVEYQNLDLYRLKSCNNLMQGNTQAYAQGTVQYFDLLVRIA